MFVFGLPVQLLYKTFLILRRTERDMVNYMYIHFLIKLEFSLQISEKYSNINFNENPSSASRVVPCGQTDGCTDKTKVTVAFHNFAKMFKNKL